MKNTYYEFLPQDYYHHKLARTVLRSLDKGENVLVGGMYGCGLHVFSNVLVLAERQRKLFKGLEKWDAEEWMSKGEKLKRGAGKRLVLIYGFEKIEDRRKALERLLVLRQSRLGEVVFLVIGDHSVVTEPESYMAWSAPFFGEKIVIAPFDRTLTSRMVEVSGRYYNWAIPKNLYPKIYELTGGIQRLVKHICRMISDTGAGIGEWDEFMGSPSINFQLELMTKILLQAGRKDLQTLGLLDEKGRIKSILLSEYYKRYQSLSVGQMFPGLSRLESKLLTLLLENKGRLVTVEKIGDMVELEGSEFSQWAIYKLVSRLKTKIRGSFRIISAKGRGYMIEQVVR